MGTVFAPPDATEGFGAYYHDFDNQSFLNWADEFAGTGAASFRKVEGVSYMMRTKYFVPNDARFAPSSFEDHMQSILMQIKGYDFVVCGKAVVWHFGARSSHFLGQHDKLTGTSDRQRTSEQKNYQPTHAQQVRYDETQFSHRRPPFKDQVNWVLKPADHALAFTADPL